jgi:hypothetical protein
LDLTEIDKDLRGMALRYATMNVHGVEGGLKSLESIPDTLGSIILESIREEFAGNDYMDIVQKTHGMAKDLAEGKEIEIGRGRVLKTGTAHDALDGSRCFDKPIFC